MNKGNPGSLTFYLDGISVLSIFFNVSLDKDINHGEMPVIEGSSPLAIAFGKAAGLGAGEKSQRVIRIGDRIEFVDKEVSYIVLKVISSRGEGIA